jgi:hypothetical protein
MAVSDRVESFHFVLPKIVHDTGGWAKAKKQRAMRNDCHCKMEWMYVMDWAGHLHCKASWKCTLPQKQLGKLALLGSHYIPILPS